MTAAIINLNNQYGFSYRVHRSKRRRTAAIQIDAGEVVVRAPYHADQQWIEHWVRSKADWILPRLERQRRAIAEHQVDLSRGTLTISGEPFQLVFGQMQQARGVELDSQARQLLIRDRQTEILSCELQRRVKTRLKEYAGRELRSLTECWGRKTGLRPADLQVRDYRRKWGQCSATGKISLNWRVIHLPVSLQDYVVVHELCHLKEMNHGAGFWTLVATAMPDYRVRRRELQQFAPYLSW